MKRSLIKLLSGVGIFISLMLFAVENTDPAIGFLVASLIGIGYLYQSTYDQKVRAESFEKEAMEKKINEMVAVADTISNGGVIPVAPKSNAILKSDEICHFSGNCELYGFIKRKLSIGSGNARIGIMKGFSISTPSVRSYDSEDSFERTDAGELSITNKRVIFTGLKSSFEIPLQKIIGISSEDDSICINSNGQSIYLKLDAGSNAIAESVIRRLASS